MYPKEEDVCDVDSEPGTATIAPTVGAWRDYPEEAAAALEFATEIESVEECSSRGESWERSSCSTKGGSYERLAMLTRTPTTASFEDGDDKSEDDGASFDGRVSGQYVKNRRKAGFPFLLVLSTLSVTVGGSMMYGFNVAVLSVPSVHIKRFFNESHHTRNGVHLEEHSERWLWSFAVALFCVGAAMGAFISGYPSNRFGRKKTIMGNNLFSICGALFMGLSVFAYSYEMLIIGRFLAGVNVGVITAVVPMYLSEISPTPIRGIVAIMHGALLNIGVALAQGLGLYVFTSADSWPLLLGVPICAISLFQLVTCVFCPESPRWLLIHEYDHDNAIKALKRLRGSEDVKRELGEMEDESASLCSRETIGIMDLVMLRRPEWKKPLILTLVCNCCVHLTGVNVIWFYLVEIFQSAGLTPSQIGIVTVWLGFGNAVFSVTSGFLFDKFGRRPVTIGSLILCIINLCGITVCMLFQEQSSWLPWLSAVLIAFQTFLATIGPGAAPFVLCTEIWSQAPRGSAMALGSQVSWLMNFIIGMLFPTMQNALGPYSFLVFASTLVVIAVYFWFSLPETKNKSFEEIAAIFSDGSSGSSEGRRKQGDNKEKSSTDCKDHSKHIYAAIDTKSDFSSCRDV